MSLHVSKMPVSIFLVSQFLPNRGSSIYMNQSACILGKSAASKSPADVKKWASKNEILLTFTLMLMIVV